MARTDFNKVISYLIVSAFDYIVVLAMLLKYNSISTVTLPIVRFIYILFNISISVIYILFVISAEHGYLTKEYKDNILLGYTESPWYVIIHEVFRNGLILVFAYLSKEQWIGIVTIVALTASAMTRTCIRDLIRNEKELA